MTTVTSATKEDKRKSGSYRVCEPFHDSGDDGVANPRSAQAFLKSNLGLTPVLQACWGIVTKPNETCLHIHPP